jgi:acetyl-CoA carboxylase biotin carboxyl carrier protein
MKIDLTRLESLVDLMERSGLSELDFHEGESRVALELLPPPPRPAGRAVAETADPGLTVTAPRVGVFHAAVAAGTHVQAGKAIGEIKVMDVKFSITAPASGLVEEVLVENGLGVEYGQPLIRIMTEEPK